MLLVDFSQIVHAITNIHISLTGKAPQMDDLRSLSISNLDTIINGTKTGDTEIILCYDGNNYWRKKIFPHYKANRKTQRDKINIDWKAHYANINSVITEFKNNLPYRSIEVEEAEADDVISTLAYLTTDQVTVISTDKDFLQLQLFLHNVKQYSPLRKEYITLETQNYDLFEHIMRGDASDGIPNILSDDDTYITEKRAKRLTKKLFENAKQYGIDNPQQFCNEEELKRFKRNQILIDHRMLEKVRPDIHQKIIDEYNQSEKPSGKLFKYLQAHKLFNLYL